MRVAVCLSGQPRTYKICSTNHLEVFENKEVIPDYFIHTWNCNDTQYEKNNNVHTFVNVDEVTSDLQRIYKPKFLEVQENECIDNTYYNSQLYSMCKALKEVRKVEMSECFRYDIVIWTRLDTYFECYDLGNYLAQPFPYKECLNRFIGHENDRVCYGGRGWSYDLWSENEGKTCNLWMDDKFFVANSRTAELFSLFDENNIFLTQNLKHIRIINEACLDWIEPRWGVLSLLHGIDVKSIDLLWRCHTGNVFRMCIVKRFPDFSLSLPEYRKIFNKLLSLVDGCGNRIYDKEVKSVAELMKKFINDNNIRYIEND